MWRRICFAFPEAANARRAVAGQGGMYAARRFSVND